MTTLPKEFYRTIQEVARKAKHTSSVKQVFNDLIQVMFNSLNKSQRVHPYNMDFDPRLVRELTEYKSQPELWAKLGELSLMWLKAIEAAAPFTDVMGSTYDEQLGECLGQFLTPPDLAACLAQLNLGQAGEQIDEAFSKGEPFYLGDITGCGAGSLTAANAFRGNVVVVEGELDEVIPHKTSANYHHAFSNASTRQLCS